MIEIILPAGLERRFRLTPYGVTGHIEEGDAFLAGHGLQPT